MDDKLKETYKGKEIVIEIHPHNHPHGGHHGGKVDLSIDGKHIHVMSVDNKFGSHYIPYVDFPSPISLAKAIIDIVPEFNNKFSPSHKTAHT